MNRIYEVCPTCVLKQKALDEAESARIDPSDLDNPEHALIIWRDKYVVQRLEDYQKMEKKVEELADINESYKAVMQEQCAPDEKHCTCVPFLRQRIRELEARLDTAREALERGMNTERTCDTCDSSYIFCAGNVALRPT